MQCKVFQKTEFRHDVRFQINYYATAEHRLLGKLILRVVNLSSTGAMVDGRAGIERGDRVFLSLPASGDFEALCLWTWHQYAGLQFDQQIGMTELATAIDVMRVIRL